MIDPDNREYDACRICLPMKLFMLFCFGGCLYTIVELLFRGNSHWSMFILGGICFILVGGLNQVYRKMPLIIQMSVSSLVITLLEFICGCIVNLWLKLDVWNYEELPFNILGQICPVFMIAWFFLSLVAIFADDFLRNRLFLEEMPTYKLV